MSELEESVARELLARGGIGIIWESHLAAEAAYRVGNVRAANILLNIADAAETIWRGKEFMRYVAHDVIGHSRRGDGRTQVITWPQRSTGRGAAQEVADVMAFSHRRASTGPICLNTPVTGYER